MSAKPGPLVRTVAFLALLLTAASCSNDGGGPPPPGDGGQGEAVGARDAVTEPCPEQLPVMAYKPSRSPYPSPVLPTLPPDVSAPDQAWVCRYFMTKSAPEGMRGPLTRTWNLTKEEAVQVSAADLAQVGNVVHEFASVNDVPLGPPPYRICLDNLGTRWLLVYTAGEDLTGIVTDDFGCQGVGTTDDPRVSVPQIDSVSLLEQHPMLAPKGFLETLKRLHATT